MKKTNINKKKKLLLNFYNHYNQITETEKSIFNEKYLEGGFVLFNEIHDSFQEIYYSVFPEERESESNSIEFIDWIVRESMKYFDSDLLSKEQFKKHSQKIIKNSFNFGEDGPKINGKKSTETTSLLLTKELYEENPHCFIKFKTIEEIIDFMETKKYI